MCRARIAYELKWSCRTLLGDRLTVRLQPLELRIGVRIPVSQPNLTSGAFCVLCVPTRAARSCRRELGSRVRAASGTPRSPPTRQPRHANRARMGKAPQSDDAEGKRFGKPNDPRHRESASEAAAARHWAGASEESAAGKSIPLASYPTSRAVLPIRAKRVSIKGHSHRRYARLAFRFFWPSSAPAFVNRSYLSGR